MAKQPKPNLSRRQLIPLSRALRHASTDAEMLLWRHLRSRQAMGVKFRRQHPFAGYILDFYCHERGLVIEVDGGQHYKEDEAKKDQARTLALQERGLRVLRFSNLEMLRETDSVLSAIAEALEEPSP